MNDEVKAKLPPAMAQLPLVRAHDHAFHDSWRSNRSSAVACTVDRVRNYHGLHYWWLKNRSFGLLGVTLVLVGGLAWTCVRGPLISRRASPCFSTTFPFGVLCCCWTLSALVRGNGGGFLCSVSGQLTLAVCLAWAAPPPAKRLNSPSMCVTRRPAARSLIRRA